MTAKKITEAQLFSTLREAGFHVFYTANPCDDPKGFQALTPEDAAEDIFAALPSGTDALDVERLARVFRENGWTLELSGASEFYPDAWTAIAAEYARLASPAEEEE